MIRAVRPVLWCLALTLPALVLRFSGLHIPPPLALLVFGLAVVAASFVLAWAAEAAEVDISGGLAIAVLAVIAVLPEYAVDLYFAYTAGGDPTYVQYAAANMTGSNRLLLGLGWTAVVLVALFLANRAAKRRGGTPIHAVLLDPRYRLELGFLAIASIVSFLIPLTGQIHIVMGVALLAFFVYYLYRAATAEDAEEHDLVGPAAAVGSLPAAQRRPIVIAMFVVAALIILASAEPFAEALIGSGAALGIDQFLLVQWLAPLASEAPEFIVAILFATRGKAGAALGMLISAKVNQWTLLVGSLPIAYAFGGGSSALPMDPRQVEEFLLTATQTVLGVSILLGLKFHRWAAITLLALFAVQFVIPGTQGRLIVSAVYAVLAVAVLVWHRRALLPTLAAPFRSIAAITAHEPEPVGQSEAEREPELVGRR